jgi:siroheme synthase
MPGHGYTEIARKLRAAGLSDEIPCAIISRATTSQEQVYSTNVGNLGDAPRLATPTLLVIGEALRHFCSAGILPAALQSAGLGEEQGA